MSKKHNKVYIYTLSSSEFPDEVRYVGKTQYLKERYSQHIKSSNIKNSKVCKWIKEVLNLRNELIMNIIDEVEEENWEKAEIGYILLYKSFGANLVNTSKGGNDYSFIGKYKKVNNKIKRPQQSIFMKNNTIWKNVSAETRKLAAQKANLTKQNKTILPKTRILSLENKEKIKYILLNNSKKLAKPVVEVDFNFKILNEYSSISEAERKLNLSGINSICLNNRCFINKKIFMFKNFTEKDKQNKINLILSKPRTAKIYNEILKTKILSGINIY